jgi:methylmalonyl-CoA/ethylmalonyl-CoA epimerase
MIKSLNHVAIVVPDLALAAAKYRNLLGARVSGPVSMPKDGIEIMFIELENTKIELVQPVAPHSTLHGFLKANPDGGIHHVCFGVDSLSDAREVLIGAGKAASTPQIGAHGNPITFLDHADFNGALIELEEIPAPAMA